MTDTCWGDAEIEPTPPGLEWITAGPAVAMLTAVGPASGSDCGGRPGQQRDHDHNDRQNREAEAAKAQGPESTGQVAPEQLKRNPCQVCRPTPDLVETDLDPLDAVRRVVGGGGILIGHLVRPAVPRIQIACGTADCGGPTTFGDREGLCPSVHRLLFADWGPVGRGRSATVGERGFGIASGLIELRLG